LPGTLRGWRGFAGHGRPRRPGDPVPLQPAPR
jgi:hypothetical protein